MSDTLLTGSSPGAQRFVDLLKLDPPRFIRSIAFYLDAEGDPATLKVEYQLNEADGDRLVCILKEFNLVEAPHPTL